MYACKFRFIDRFVLDIVYNAIVSILKLEYSQTLISYVKGSTKIRAIVDITSSGEGMISNSLVYYNHHYWQVDDAVNAQWPEEHHNEQAWIMV